jgi:transposase
MAKLAWTSGAVPTRVVTRYDKLAANYLAFVKLACIRLWLRVYESTP